jgi:type I restriction enzyme, S subunit
VSAAWRLLEEPAPAGWETRRVGDLVELTNGFPFSSDRFGLSEGLPLVRIRDLFSDEFATFVSGPVPDPVVLRDGDIVIGMDGDFELTVWQRGPAALNQRLCLLRPRAGVAARFIAYALPRHLRVLNDLTYATTVKHLSSFDILSERILCPPADEQRAIADYLDGETAEIDGLISGLKHLLSLTFERHASFRDWMLAADAGERTRRLSSVLSARITDGPHETPEFVDEGVPFLSVDNIFDDQISFEGCRRISEQAHSVYARKSLPRRGDVLLTKAAAVGRVALVETDQVFNVWSPLAILRPDPAVVVPQYLHIALLGGTSQSRMKLASTSNTQENLSMRDLAALRLAVPNLKRQAEVISQVAHSAEAARTVASLVHRQVELLRERRHALITAAITGELQIPGVPA